MAFKRSAVRSRLSPPEKVLKSQDFRTFSIILLYSAAEYGAERACPELRAYLPLANLKKFYIIKGDMCDVRTWSGGGCYD